jgi:hypothetical protein
MMDDFWNRQRVLKQLMAVAGTLMLPARRAAGDTSGTEVRDTEIQISTISEHTFRCSILRLKNGLTSLIPFDGSLAQPCGGTPVSVPYIYSAVRDCTLTGMPFVLALWLHFPDDAQAVGSWRPVHVGEQSPGCSCG